MKERLQEERKQWENKHQQELAKVKKTIVSPSPILPSNAVNTPKIDDDSSNSIRRPEVNYIYEYISINGINDILFLLLILSHKVHQLVQDQV